MRWRDGAVNHNQRCCIGGTELALVGNFQYQTITSGAKLSGVDIQGFAHGFLTPLSPPGLPYDPSPRIGMARGAYKTRYLSLGY